MLVDRELHLPETPGVDYTEGRPGAVGRVDLEGVELTVGAYRRSEDYLVCMQDALTGRVASVPGILGDGAHVGILREALGRRVDDRVGDSQAAEGTYE